MAYAKLSFIVIVAILFVIYAPYTIFSQHNVTTSRITDLSNAHAVITDTAPKGPDVEDKLVFHQREDGAVSLSMTHRQMCDVCHATMDTGIILLRRALSHHKETKDMSKQDRRKILQQTYGGFGSTATYDAQGRMIWDSYDMADEICESAMSLYKPHFTFGCHGIIAEHYDSIWKPYDHIQSYQNMLSNVVYLQHKTDFCFVNRYCFATRGLTDEAVPSLATTPKKRGKCESCLELAHDARMILRRVMTTIKNPDNDPLLAQKCVMKPDEYKAFIDTWCNSLSLRHYRPSILEDICSEITSDYYDELYQLIKNGNTLHTLLKDIGTWEDVFCIKLTGYCTAQYKEELYLQWDEAADYDFNVTHITYDINKEIELHTSALQRLEEEYFYSDKHMIYDPAKENIDNTSSSSSSSSTTTTTTLDNITTDTHDQDMIDIDDISLVDNDNNNNNNNNDDDYDEGNIIVDNLPPRRTSSTTPDDDDDQDDTIADNTQTPSSNNNNPYNTLPDDELIEDNSDEEWLLDSLGRRVWGKLHHIDEDGKRVPNQLPPFLLREYKAKRYDLLHSVKHSATMERLKKELDTLTEKAPQYHGKRRVYALPDTSIISKRVSSLVTEILARQAEKDDGIIASDMIKQSVQQDINEMNTFSAHFEQDHGQFHQLFDLDLDDTAWQQGIENLDTILFADKDNTHNIQQSGTILHGTYNNNDNDGDIIDNETGPSISIPSYKIPNNMKSNTNSSSTTGNNNNKYTNKDEL